MCTWLLHMWTGRASQHRCVSQGVVLDQLQGTVSQWKPAVLSGHPIASPALKADSPGHLFANTQGIGATERPFEPEWMLACQHACWEGTAFRNGCRHVKKLAGNGLLSGRDVLRARPCLHILAPLTSRMLAQTNLSTKLASPKHKVGFTHTH